MSNPAVTAIDFTATDYTLIEEKTAYQGFFALRKLTLKHKLFKGGWTQPIQRELFVRGQAVGVLAYDPWQDKVVMVEQFRIGALNDPKSPWLLEVIAGMIEENEPPEAVAHRETKEESGLTLLHLEHLYTYYSSPGGSDEQIILYLGIVDSNQINNGDIGGLATEHEDLRVTLLHRADAVQETINGKAANTLSIIALQWLTLNHQRLQADWAKQSPQ